MRILLLVLVSAVNAAQSPHQQLAREVLRELVEINTSEKFGTQAAAGAVAARLRSAGFAADEVHVIGSRPHRSNLVAPASRIGRGAPDPVPRALRDWSPDGKRIVFTIADKSWQRVGLGGFPRWLPDGRRLLAQSQGRLKLVDMMTRGARDVYAETERAIGSHALAPDARRLYFTASIVEPDIWVMRFDAQNRSRSEQ